jgi:phosphoribosylglycinamide formyltransferase-1
VLISGRGSNLQAIIDAAADGRIPASVGVVIANRRGAAGLDRARAHGIETVTLPHGDWADRDAYDAALVEALRAHEVDLVCLAGFMRLLGPAFVEAFPNAILNVHPSLLPAFPGVDAPAQAVAHGVRVSGATVHLVNADLDAGPIVLQACVPVRVDDAPETLAARILEEEHRLYPEAIRIVLEGHWRIDGRRFVRLAASST